MAKRRIRKYVPKTWEEAREGFIIWKQAQGLSERTIKDYHYHVSNFFKHYPQAYTHELRPSVLEYMARPVKPATFNKRLVNLRAFFEWCIQEDVFEENPLDGFRQRKAEGRVVNLDEKILSRLLSLPDKTSFSGFRDYCLLLLTLDTGIRPKEAFSLLVEDIHFRSLEVHIRSDVAKTRVSRTLPVSPMTAHAIRDLISARHPVWKDNVPIFCTAEGGFLNTWTWGDRLEIYSKRLGVHIRPYDLRHAFALQFLRNGGQAFALQRTLGHTDLAMTKRYVALTQQDLRQQHSIASPLNTLVPQKQRVRKIK